MTTWTIGAEQAGLRLDHFLVQTNPTLSRTSVQNATKRGEITVNDQAPTVHRFLKEGDVIAWNAPVLADQPKALPIVPPTVIAETDDWIVLNKPSGVLVHPSHAHQREPSLMDWLYQHVPGISKASEDPSRPGIVHRLDKDVSGLMVVAKNHPTYESLKKQFAHRNVEKKYIALLHGTLPDDEGEVKLRIARSTSRARMAARPEHESGGKAAWTHYRVVQRFPGATLAELDILSGRTHQIRAHMHALGCPVVGDPLYKAKRMERAIETPRILLQSIHLGFTDPASGERKVFDLEVDPLITKVVAGLK